MLDVSRTPAGQGWLGNYKLIAELGHGGMADVYLGLGAAESYEKKLFVLKRLRNVEDDDATAMFLDEARIAIRLHHPNVVRTFEVAWESEVFSIVMEFLHGPTLQQLRRRARSQGGLPLRFELYILSQALRGLQYAHELSDAYGAPLRIVHRDFTPQNIIITHRGVPKVLDFGIAKAADSAVQTQAGMYKGKLSYMPPEQLIGKRVDHRADLFAAGAMLYTALTGRQLWDGADSNSILHRLAAEDIPVLKNVKASVGPELVDLCRRALAPKPIHRVSSSAEMRKTLEVYCGVAGLHATQEDLARYIQSLFGDEQRQHQALIRKQLGREHSLPSASTASSVVGLPLLQVGGSQWEVKAQAPGLQPPGPAPVVEPETASGAMAGIDVELTGDYPQVPAWRRWHLPALGAMVVAATLAFFVGKTLGSEAALQPTPETSASLSQP